MDGLRFETLLDHIPEALVVLNPQNEVVFINSKARAFEKIATRPFSLGVTFPDLMPEDRREIVSHLLHSIKIHRTVQVLEAEYKDPEGRSSFYESIYDPVIDADNRLEFICVFFREKTIEKIFEKKSTQLLHDYSNLIEHANAVIFSIDSKSYITDWNSECVSITKYNKDEVFARKLDEFIDDYQRNQFNDFLDKILEGVSVVNFELYFKRKDGSVIIILLNATPKINHSGRVVGVLFVGHDITELSEYRQSLEEKIKDGTEKLRMALEKEKALVDIKNRFVSMASHEFRVPLSTITTAVNFIKRSKGLEEESLEKLNTIEKQIGHMRLLIDDVLTLGKADVAKLKATYQKFNLIPFLENIMGEVLNGQSTHQIKFDFSHPLVEIESDEKLLRNIFINLLSNAVKFSPDHHLVNMELERRNNHVEVKITDRGIGIKAEDLEKIFVPFNRGSNTGSIKGTGLGLSIVKRATEALGGSIAIDSKPGAGTSVVINLPC